MSHSATDNVNSKHALVAAVKPVEQEEEQQIAHIHAPVAELEDANDLSESVYQDDNGPELNNVESGTQRGRGLRNVSLPRLFTSASVHGNRNRYKIFSIQQFQLFS